MKKTLSFLLVAVLLLSVAIPVAAAGEAVIVPEVLYSITEDEDTLTGLAFQFHVNATGVVTNNTNEFDNTKATVRHNGEDVKLVRMGAVVTNVDAVGQAVDAMVLENLQGQKVIAIEAKKLYHVETSYCSFVVRIIKIPESGEKMSIYARPYYVAEVDGEEVTIYGSISVTSHFSQWCKSQPEVKLPAVGTDIDVKNKRDRIRVSDAAIVDRTVTLTFHNYTTKWITEETNWVQYTCYDADGNIVQAATKIHIGCIDTKKNKTKTFTFEVPDATAEVKLTNSNIVYWTEWA